MSDFELRTLTQRWLLPDQSDGDFCSHGTIRLVVGGQVVTDGEELYGLSPSALALLRTLESDHTLLHPVAQQLIFHGCGLILMSGCPIGLNWSVVHVGKAVELSDIRRHDTASNTPTQQYPRVVTVPASQYEQQVLAFASVIKAFVETSPEKHFREAFDREQYEQFWAEYLVLLQRHGAA